MGGVALFGMLAYLFTPLSAAGAEGAPVGFGINIRYAIPALLAGLDPAAAAARSSLPTGPRGDSPRSTRLWQGRARQWVLAGRSLLVVLVVTDRSDAVLRDPDRLFAWRSRCSVVLRPGRAALRPQPRGAARRDRGRVRRARARRRRDRLPGPARLPARPLPQRGCRNEHPRHAPRLGLPLGARRQDARIGLAGTTAGFLEYGFYGTDLSNRVRYLGVEGPARRLQRDPDLRRLPRRRQRRRPRLPGHLAVPQLHPPRRAGPLARGRAGCAASRR